VSDILDDKAEDYVATNLSWDQCESAHWDTCAANTFKEGFRFCVELAERWNKANPESSFHPNLSSWQLYDFLKKQIDEATNDK
jgi:hypothetical protein